MPVIGEIRLAKEIGRKVPHKGSPYIYHACIDCGKPRWVILDKSKPSHERCSACVARNRIFTDKTKKKMSISHKGLIGIGEKNSNWQGGKNYVNGYILVWLPRDNFFYPMTDKKGYIREHRLIMAQSLGRCLQPFENVHHKNGVKNDNRLENLELTMQSAHMINHHKGYKDGYAKGLIDGRDKQIKELKARIIELESQIRAAVNREL